MAESQDMVGRTEVGEAVACLLEVMGMPRMLVGKEPNVMCVSNTGHRGKNGSKFHLAARGRAPGEV